MQGSSLTSAALAEALKRVVLKARRSQGGLKVRALASKINVSQASVYAYLSGETLPPADRLDSLLELLAVPSAERLKLLDMRDEIQAARTRRIGDGLNDAAPAVATGPPVIEVVLSDGAVEIADIIDAHEAAPTDMDLAGSYDIESLTEHVVVDGKRTISQVTCARRVRAIGPVDRFLYSMECPSDSGLHRVVIDPRENVKVSKVIRVTDVAYVFHLELDRPLAPGESSDIEFLISTDEDRNQDSRGIYGKRQFVSTGTVHLSVEFSESTVPLKVRWFSAPFPLGDFPDGFRFSDENVVEPTSTGSYYKMFEKADLPLGRIVGLAWDYPA